METLFHIQCVEDGTLMGDHWSGRPRTRQEADKMVESLNKHGDLHYQIIGIERYNNKQLQSSR